MGDLLIFLSFTFVEVLVIWFVYNNVVKVELLVDIEKKELDICEYRKSLFEQSKFIYFFLKKYKKKTCLLLVSNIQSSYLGELKSKINEIKEVFIGTMMYDGITIIFYPLVSYIMFKVLSVELASGEIPSLLFILLLCVIMKSTYTLVNKNVENIISLHFCVIKLKVYIDEHNLKLEEEFNNLDNKRMFPVLDNKKVSVMILVGLILAVLLFVSVIALQRFLFSISDNPNIQQFSGIFILVYILFYAVKNKVRSIRNNKNIKKEIAFEGSYFYIHEDKIKDLCKKIGVDNVTFKYKRMKNWGASAETNTNEISINSGLLLFIHKWINDESNIKSFDADQGNGEADDKVINIFYMIICHELIHIKFNDMKWIENRVRLSGILYIISLISIITLLLYIKHPIIDNFLVVLFVFVILISTVTMSENYWKQMAEIRADHYSLKVIDDITTFEYFCKLSEVIESEERYSQLLNRENFLYKKYKRLDYPNDHPVTKTRLKYTKSNKNWGMYYYLTHLVQMLWWRTIKRSWNGL